MGNAEDKILFPNGFAKVDPNMIDLDDVVMFCGKNPWPKSLASIMLDVWYDTGRFKVSIRWMASCFNWSRVKVRSLLKERGYTILKQSKMGRKSHGILAAEKKTHSRHISDTLSDSKEKTSGEVKTHKRHISDHLYQTYQTIRQNIKIYMQIFDADSAPRFPSRSKHKLRRAYQEAIKVDSAFGEFWKTYPQRLNERNKPDRSDKALAYYHWLVALLNGATPQKVMAEAKKTKGGRWQRKEETFLSATDWDGVDGIERDQFGYEITTDYSDVLMNGKPVVARGV